MTETVKQTLIVQQLPDSDPIIGVALWGLEDARRRTRQALRGMNPSALDWQLKGGGHSVGTLLYHIAAIEIDWLYSDVLGQDMPENFGQLFPHDVRDAAGKLTIVKGESLDSLWSRLDKV